MDVLTSDLARQIKKYRKERGLTVAKVAAELGLQESNYRKYENGSRVPKHAVVVQLANIFECSPAALYNNEKEAFFRVAMTTANALATDKMRCYTHNGYCLADFWSYWHSTETVDKLRTFFAHSIVEHRLDRSASMEELVVWMNRFLHEQSGEQADDMNRRCQAGLVFFDGVIQQLDCCVAQGDTVDSVIIERFRCARGLGDSNQARQDFLTLLYLPFIFFLREAVSWSEDNEALITNKGFQRAIIYHFYNMI